MRGFCRLHKEVYKRLWNQSEAFGRSVVCRKCPTEDNKVQQLHLALTSGAIIATIFAMEANLKQLRNKAKMTQQEAADLFNVSLRSYKSYENDPQKADSIKYKYMVHAFVEKTKVDEDHGILTMEEIKEVCSSVFANYPVEFCYLFGSYAKGKATEDSDVDLLVSSDLKGIKYYGLVERLKNSLHKNVDVLAIKQLLNNPELTKEILKDGVKIYG